MKTKTYILKPILQAVILAGISGVSIDSAQALPRVDAAVETGSVPVKVFPDHERDDVYWYIPISIDPWTRNSQYKSSLYENDTVLSFVFRGQASVNKEMLEEVAENIGVPVGKLVPISYERSENLICQNFYADNPQTKWIFPSSIGNYLEVLPISFRTTDPQVKEEVSYHFNHGGLGCTVGVKFKAVSTAYKLKFTANMNDIYKRFESAAHAQGLWWEVDLHALTEKLRREKIIEIEAYQDDTLPDSEFKTQLKAAWDEVVSQITANLFTRTLKLPDGPMAGRGKAWSLRSDYRYSEEQNHYVAILQSKSVSLKESLISVRMAIK